MTSEGEEDVMNTENHEADSGDESVGEHGTPGTPLPEQIQNHDSTSATAGVSLSKNQQKKLRRKQQWEDGREDRKAKRKEKMKLKKERKRTAQNEEAAEPDAAAHMDGEQAEGNEDSTSNGNTRPKLKTGRPVQLPITFVLDCSFDDLMTENEIISLGSQLTRSYSDIRKSHFRAHLAISSYGGRLKERFEGILANSHKGWKGVRFLEEDWVKVAEQASSWMKERGGGVVDGALVKPDATENAKSTAPFDGEIIYLSSDSSETLTELKPYSTYIIGGLVDRNRHKGVCYKRALDANVRTAKLPIGEFMQMNSRSVLATNHVVEIMVRWLGLGDWGKAFMEVIPKRKGGVLKGDNDSGAASPAEENVPQEGSLGDRDSEPDGEKEDQMEVQEAISLLNDNGRTESEASSLKRKHEESTDVVQNGSAIKRLKEVVDS